MTSLPIRPEAAARAAAYEALPERHPDGHRCCRQHADPHTAVVAAAAADPATRLTQYAYGVHGRSLLDALVDPVVDEHAAWARDLAGEGFDDARAEAARILTEVYGPDFASMLELEHSEAGERRARRAVDNLQFAAVCQRRLHQERTSAPATTTAHRLRLRGR